MNKVTVTVDVNKDYSFRILSFAGWDVSLSEYKGEVFKTATHFKDTSNVELEFHFCPKCGMKFKNAKFKLRPGESLTFNCAGCNYPV